MVAKFQVTTEMEESPMVSSDYTASSQVAAQYGFFAGGGS